ncbi:hypothetical protein FH832_002880 [Listeria monocytogenes]|uniref:TRADD-N-associated membrane domain-containing protein n=1 Tax=Priestia megaterium TaxID=1404 RepID=UPI000BFB48CE|nr:hypothetical protein [Priestia megaterium]EGI2114816.1 hypothetical protein [Listeria monocytogenes]PGN53940.1 hypothetical protein CN978_30020 [Priestia megaterium]
MKFKFEYVIAVMVLTILGAALFYFDDSEVRNTIITALVGALSAITAYFFTKHNPNNKNDD